MTEQLAQQLGVSVRSVFAGLGNYLSLITRNNPHGVVKQLFGRPDVAAIITSAVEEAREAAHVAVLQAWGQENGPAGHAVLDHLLHDVEKAYSPILLRSMVRQAYLSVLNASFIPGVTPPGVNPTTQAAARRAAAVAAAVESFAARAIHRNALSIDVAAGHARTVAQIDEARASGQALYKRWRAHIDSPVCCHWCRKLNGVTIPLTESFAPHIGPAVDLTGHGHLTKPPKPYKGLLPGPKLHPHCQCWLEIVPAPGDVTVPSAGGQEPARSPAPAAGFLAASEIRAMPEEKFRSLTAFLRASVHELGQVLRRLARRGRSA